MKTSANAIRQGSVLEHKGELWLVIKKPEHTKPGKGPAYVQVEMKNLKKHNKTIERFSSTDDVEIVKLEYKELQFLYNEEDNLILMDQNTFEQVSIPKSMLGDMLPFIVDEMVLTVEMHEDDPINIKLPATVVVTVEQTNPSIKGSTATPSYKPATLTNGVKVMVPPYLESGEKIVIKTEDLSFVERAK